MEDRAALRRRLAPTSSSPSGGAVASSGSEVVATSALRSGTPPSLVQRKGHWRKQLGQRSGGRISSPSAQDCFDQKQPMQEFGGQESTTLHVGSEVHVYPQHPAVVHPVDVQRSPISRQKLATHRLQVILNPELLTSLPSYAAGSFATTLSNAVNPLVMGPVIVQL